MDIQDQSATTVADHDLEGRVRNYLFGNKMPMLRDIEVEAFGDRVILSGRVRLYYHKQLCVSCCRRVVGVRTIDDQIVVEPDSAVTAPVGDDLPAAGNLAKEGKVPRRVRKPR